MTNEIITNSILNILLGFVVAGTLALFIWAVSDYIDNTKPRKIQKDTETYYTSCPKCFWATKDNNRERLLAVFQTHYAQHEQEASDTAKATAKAQDELMGAAARNCEHKTIFTEWAEGPYDLQLKYEIAVCSTCGTIVSKKTRN